MCYYKAKTDKHSIEKAVVNQDEQILGVREKFIFSEEFIIVKFLNTRHKSEDC